MHRLHLFITVYFLMSAVLVSAQIPVDTTEVKCVSWGEAQRQTSYEWFVSREARAVADSIVKYQLPSGGWAKNQDWGLGPDAIYMEDCIRTGIGSTIDNDATYTELRFLAKMYRYTNLIDYRVAFLRGLDYLLEMQYPNGGWPQFYPSRGEGHYSNHITFNDHAMINVMRFLEEVADNGDPYDMLWLTEEQRERCREAYKKGVECILNCQIVVDGQLTVWCQQHDEVTLKPAQGRAYELPSFCGAGETTAIVELLLKQEEPSERMILAIDAAIRWLENHKIEGVAVERFTNEQGQRDIRVVEKPGAGPIWARFYDLINGEPLFCGRDGIPRKHLADIEYERRNGYSWYGTQPERLIRRYKEWSDSVLGVYIMDEE